MSRWIEADALIEKKWQTESEACFYALEDVVSVTDIEEAPSIDLVRCRDCRYYRDFDGCFFSTDGVDENDYCSHGERKESE